MILNNTYINPYFSQPPHPHKPNRILIYCEKTAPMTFFKFMSNIGLGVLYSFVYNLIPRSVPFSCFYIKTIKIPFLHTDSSVSIQTNNIFWPNSQQTCILDKNNIICTISCLKRFWKSTRISAKNPMSFVWFILQINDSNVFYNSLLVSKIGLTDPLLLTSCEDIEIDMFGGHGFEI